MPNPTYTIDPSWDINLLPGRGPATQRFAPTKAQKKALEPKPSPNAQEILTS